ncbi:protein of unknown function [Geoalkalibacter ferrihydriticus]|uniref:DUF4168 domain-containing protein n=2 Tax=Geoalkalibacter ferrihydriticus TaxID=392333 RepID=A0A0C2DXI5_9BACT|nr:DUF4168 domain-containing protein [Geoalkalibacter ferrihydriticus]KIH78144.1 hypothetical protein GFER_06145 [Geoalkalibacter ferrihydriticus DSM 17813]SDM81101.1 protein of unknown function [Geoalkalibacter ferrihydriticus]
MENTFRKSRKVLFAGALIASLALAATPALAQPGYGAAPAEQATSQQFDAQTLDQFAEAAIALSEIQEEFAEQLHGVQDQEQAMAMQEQINEKMVQSVQEQGLEVQTYNAIANQMNADPQLQAQVQQLIVEKMDN